MAEFNTPYQFGANNKEVVIRHPHNKHLRINPNAKDNADPHGGTGQWARWIVELYENGSRCKIKSKATGKYLRIEPNASVDADNKIDVKGTGGKWTVFKVHKQGQPGHVKLESVEQGGKYVAVQGDQTIRVGSGGKWTLLRFFRERPPPEFVNPYLFAKTNTVVIQHKGGGNGDNHTKFFRTDPNGSDNADPDGGKGAFAQFEADPQNGGSQVRFKSLKTGKYLRIYKGGDEVDIGGGGGKFTVFKVHKSGGGTVKLESTAIPGKYLAVGKQNRIRSGVGGKWCEFKIFRKR